MEERVFEAALAGLLHDVGKFAQRANIGLSEKWNREAGKDFGYQHALYSGDFVDQYLPDGFKAISPPSYHHRPTNDLDRIVQLADWLSSAERDEDDATHPMQLLSIFSRVEYADVEDGEIYKADQLYMPLAPLELKNTALFPSQKLPDSGMANRYKSLWDGEELEVPWKGFVKEATELKKAHTLNGDLPTYLESMLLLMQRYIWCIPSAYYKHMPDISLYDHSRITAAISACLVSHSNDQIQKWLNRIPDQVPILLLVEGDLSGIQNFIFTISSRGAASALRGRSLYLQLLTEAIARFILRELGLPATNIIQSGGGRFSLLVRASDQEELPRLRERISRSLVAFHRGDLFLGLEWIPLTVNDFHGRVLSKRRKELGDLLRYSKSHKFSELGADMHRLLFVPRRDQGNQEKECAVCGREHTGTREIQKIPKCPQCLDFEELGKDLRKANYLLLSEINPQEIDEEKYPGNIEEALACFGVAASLWEGVPTPAGNAPRNVIFALKDEAYDALAATNRTAIGRRFLVNVTPSILGALELDQLRRAGVRDLPPETAIQSGVVKPFEALASHAHGIKRLGVLRMDVDNMGKIFAEGLGDFDTLSRYATLSSMINLFFEGWAAELARKYNPSDFKGSQVDRVYSIYAGGDDLFFIGAWDAIPELALEIQRDLHRFTANHKGIHASAGIALVGGRYPLYQSAEDAQNALDEAKNPSLRKNAITIFNQRVPWDDFENLIYPTMLNLKELTENREVPQALLQRLQQFQLQYEASRNARADSGQSENQVGQEQIFWGSWHWHSAYYLKRLENRHKNAKDNILKLREDLRLENFRAIQWIGLAARWVDLLTR